MSDEQKPKPTKITSVSFGMTVNIGNFENVKFDLTAQVPADEDWRDVLASLKRKSDRLKEMLQDKYGRG